MAKFVDNEKFYSEMVAWKEKLYQNQAQGMSNPRPDIPEYIGECIWKIASRFATKPNWRNAYTDDMVGDAVEECIKYLDRFNEKKSTNPFSYFTQVVYYSFLRRISKEKRYLYVKYKVIMNSEVSDFFEGAENQVEFNKEELLSKFQANEYIEYYENNVKPSNKKKKKKKSVETIEKFIT
tara:strand:+ start:2558 stop:3097 length:540 start_codon:yes stop_codon:yes gene_type:complete